jgi:hypothetical protein
MYEKEVIVTTKYGQMPSFVACPDGPGQASQYPGISSTWTRPAFARSCAT